MSKLIAKEYTRFEDIKYGGLDVDDIHARKGLEVRGENKKCRIGQCNSVLSRELHYIVL